MEEVRPTPGEAKRRGRGGGSAAAGEGESEESLEGAEVGGRGVVVQLQLEVDGVDEEEQHDEPAEHVVAAVGVVCAHAHLPLCCVDCGG